MNLSSEIDEQIGLKIRKLRVAAAVSEQKAARHCNLSTADYTASEFGFRRLAPKELFELSHLFGFRVADLFTDLSISEAAPSYKDERFRLFS